MAPKRKATTQKHGGGPKRVSASEASCRIDVVDALAGLNHLTHSVYWEDNGEKREYWCAMLNQTNLANNNNKFYFVQLIKANDSSKFYAFFRWGRVGASKPAISLFPFGDLEKAQACFKKKYLDKTKNHWDERDNFETYPNKYTQIELECMSEDDGVEDGEDIDEEKPECDLPTELQDLVSLIFSKSSIRQDLKSMNVDIDKLPLGKLSQAQIDAGYEVLTQITRVLNGEEASPADEDADNGKCAEEEEEEDEEKCLAVDCVPTDGTTDTGEDGEKVKEEEEEEEKGKVVEEVVVKEEEEDNGRPALRRSTRRGRAVIGAEDANGSGAGASGSGGASGAAGKKQNGKANGKANGRGQASGRAATGTATATTVNKKKSGVAKKSGGVRGSGRRRAGVGCMSATTRSRNLAELTARFYTLVPHNFGMRRPEVIATLAKVQEKVALLEVLRDVGISAKLKKESAKDKEHPLQAQYKSLKAEMGVLDKTSPEFRVISDAVTKTQGPTHNASRMEVQEVFSLDRSDEADAFSPYEHAANRQLLWHGSRLSNMVGILSQGLRIAPPEAPSTGYMFGKGVYFADVCSKSANYCHANEKQPFGLLLLAEVCLEESKEMEEAHDFKVPPAGFQSVMGCGKYVPDPAGQTTVGGAHNEAVLHTGRPVRVEGRQASSLLYNEFIVYDTARLRLRYVVKVKHDFDVDDDDDDE